jgi:RNA polymerase sigma factor (sigma-70 family)
MNEALDEREREVLRMRYGLKDGVQYTQDEISRCLRLSRQRVAQIEKRALLRLRQHAEASSLRGYLN